MSENKSRAAQAVEKFEAANHKVFDYQGQQLRVNDRVEVSKGYPEGVGPEDDMPADFTNAMTGQVEALLAGNKARVKIDDPEGDMSGSYSGEFLRPE